MNAEFDSYWGIDVSKAWLDIAIDNKTYHIEQTPSAIRNFIQQHKIETNKTLVVLESTGGYEKLVVENLRAVGFHVHVAHPNKVHAFAKAKGRLAKTDKIDAQLLSAYGRFIDKNAIREPLSAKQQELQMLGARLEQLKAMHHQESCRKGMTSKAVKKSHELMLKVLKKEVATMEYHIEKLIQADEELAANYTLLRSMKGVGPTLAMVLLTDLPELGKVNKKEIAALVGVAPITQQSGQKTGKAMTRYGRQGVRKVLYMATLVACKHNVKLKEFYDRLVKAGKPKKVAIVAAMRKMLVILNAMVQSKTCFNA